MTTVPTPPRAVTIFGREPAALLGLLEAVLAVLVVFPLGAQMHVDAGAIVVIMAFVSAAIGVYSAIATKDTLLGVVVGLVKAGVGLGAYYGLELRDEQNVAVVALTAVLVGFFQRTQTSPMEYSGRHRPAIDGYLETYNAPGWGSTVPGTTLPGLPPTAYAADSTQLPSDPLDAPSQDYGRRP